MKQTKVACKNHQTITKPLKSATQNIIIKNKDVISIEHINVRSLTRCWEEVKLLLLKNNTDILCLSETWLSNQTPDSLLQIPGYNIFRQDYAFNKGGGVAIFIRKEFSTKQVKNDLPTQENIEDLWINVQYRKNPSFLIGVVYRHPNGNQNTFDYLNTVLNKMLRYAKPLYALGDLNDDQLSSKKSKLKTIITKNGLHQIIENPTRICKESATLIDVIITNRKETVDSWKNDDCHIADHNIIGIQIKYKKPKKEPIIRTFRCTKNYSRDNFCNALCNQMTQFDQILETDDINTQVAIFVNAFKECLEMCAPIVTKVLSRPPLPWINDTIKNKMKVRDSLLQRARKDFNNSAKQDQYKNCKKEVKSLMMQAQSEYYEKRLTEN